MPAPPLSPPFFCPPACCRAAHRHRIYSASPSANPKYRAEVSAKWKKCSFIAPSARRTREPSAACSAAPFQAVTEDVYDLWSLETDGKTSRVVNSHVAPLGVVSRVFRAAGAGQAVADVRHVPLPREMPRSQASASALARPRSRRVRTVLALNCSLKLANLPEEYAGGLGVSSSTRAGARPGRATGCLRAGVPVDLGHRCGSGKKRSNRLPAAAPPQDDLGAAVFIRRYSSLISVKIVDAAGGEPR